MLRKIVLFILTNGIDLNHKLAKIKSSMYDFGYIFTTSFGMIIAYQYSQSKTNDGQGLEL